jgi:hypothetical protein
MKYRKWSPEDVKNLLSLPLESLLQMYPEQDRNSLGNLKKYYINKLKRRNAMETTPQPNQEGQRNPSRLDKIAELLERSGISTEDIERVERINVWQGFIKNQEGEIEYADLASATFIPKRDEADETFLSQADPVTIRPSRAKPPKRDYSLIFAFGDAQIAYRKVGEDLIPIHDERAMSVARTMCKDLRPDVIVNLGDTVDLPNLSKYDPDSNHFLTTLQQSFNRVHTFYAELRADNPEAKIVEVDSNHNARIGKFVLKHAMEFYGLRQAGQPPEAWPVLTYPFLANLDAVGVEWVSGYEAAEYHYSDDLIFIHGKEVRSNGSTAELLSKKYPYTNVVAGHGHKAQTHTRTTNDGKYLTAIQAGTLCKTTGEVPGYGTAVDDMGVPVRKQMDWQQGVVVIKDYGEGYYEFTHVYIKDGKAFYNGKEYNDEQIR